MDDLANLKIAFGLITIGLQEKEENKQKGKYYYSQKLIHGINIFQALNYYYNKEKFDFSNLHEQYFIENYAMKPIKNWFKEWKDVNELNLEDQYFYHMEALIGDIGYNTFEITDECRDYIEIFVEKELIAGIEQRVIYDYLKSLSQDDYVNLRKYLIENPIVEESELRGLKRSYLGNEQALKALENAYEEIKEDCYVCPKCGWTLIPGEMGMRCQSRSCNEAKYIKGGLKRIYTGLRLKRGVMRYIAVPGKLELEIYNYCHLKKLKSALWPYKDRYDIEIYLPNGDIWAIDAKAVRNPYFLKELIKTDNGFPIGNYKRAYYVIPNEFVKERTDYLDIINKELDKMNKFYVRCIRLTDLKKELRQRI